MARSTAYRTPTRAVADLATERLAAYAAGEMVGGLFFHNYCSGTGLMSGATFGRLAGRNAAQWAAQTKSATHA
jgi:tricarballylate dehydrogenase